MKAYGVDLRKRVLKDCDGGMTEAAAAEKWQVSAKWIQKIKKQRRDTGSIEPKIPKTGPKRKLGPHLEFLRKIVAETSDATLEEIRERLPVAVSVTTVFNELRRLKLAYKKNSSMPPNGSDPTLPKNAPCGK